jgi:hypothetical protein
LDGSSDGERRQNFGWSCEPCPCTQDVHKGADFTLSALSASSKSEIGGYFSCSLAFAAYDFYHQQRGLPQGGGVAPLVAPLRGNVDLLGLLHVADVPGRHAPGTGVMDYTAIYRGLRREGYRG